MKGAWKHPAGHFALKIGAGWKVEPAALVQENQETGQATVYKVIALKEGFTAQVQHYPTNGISDDAIGRAFSGPILAAGFFLDWRQEEINGNKLYYAFLSLPDKTILTSYIRYGDLTFGIDISKGSEAQKEKLKELAENIAASITVKTKLGCDPTHNNSYLIGKWTVNSSDYAEGLFANNSFDVGKSWIFRPDGILEYHEVISFCGSGEYGEADEANSEVGYYRILDNFMYIYANSIVLAPFTLDSGFLQLGAQQLVKVS